jgi:hypothetical protein
MAKRFHSENLRGRNICQTYLYLFIYGLFNNTVSNLDYTASNNRMSNEQLSGKDVQGCNCSPL